MRASKMIIAIAVALSCSLNAFGQKKEKNGGKDKEVKEAAAPKPHHDQGGMNLTDEQKKKMKDIHLRTEKEVLPLQNQLGEKKARLRTLTTVDKPDMNEINKTIDEMSAIKTQIMKKRIAAKMEIRGLLNDEQRLKFDMKHDKHMKFKHGPKGKPHGEQYKHYEHHDD